jgi:hypothetical protein
VIPPSVKSLAVTVTPSSLDAPGATAQLSVVATLSDASIRNITNGTEGTTYTSSNPLIGTVSANGLVTAGNQSGTVIVSLVNDGVFASKMIMVNLTSDRDGDGMPDDFEEANDCLDPDAPDGDADPDSDDLANLNELNEGTNPCDADTDDDGLNDGLEVSLGCADPTLDDTDRDGLKDGDETNPGEDDDGDGLDNICDSDRDNDGLPDGIEVRICNTPSCADPNVDSDRDNLPNLEEVNLGTDPTKPDTDGDSINDGEEVVEGTDGFETNPKNQDTDDDGFPDGLEIVYQVSPIDQTSVPTFSTPGEAVGTTLSIMNMTSPSEPPATSEAVSPTFSVQNQASP